MKRKISLQVMSVVMLVAYLLSACTGAAPAPTTSGGGDKPLAMPVTYVGQIESISGDQWTINGVTVTVSPDALKDTSFNIGDTIKVEAVVNADGSITITSVETASDDDMSLPELGDDDANSNDANSNDDVNSNDDSANSNDDQNSNDDDANTNDDDTNVNSNDDDSSDDDANSNSGDDSNSNDDDSNSNSDDDGSDDNGNDDDGSGSNSNSGDDDSNDDNSND